METNICKIKFRRGVEKDRKNIIPEEGEPIFTTDSHRLCIGDGETQGGIPITKTYFESDTDKSKIKGDFEYKDGNLYLYTSDGKSVPVGGVASVSGIISNGLESVNGAIQVKQGDGITVNANGVSVNPSIINAVNTITKLDTDVSALNSTAMKAPLAPIYNNAYAMYASINGKANIPIRIDDIKDTLQKVEGENGVYTFDSNNTTVINKIKTKLNLPANVNIQSIGVNNGCVLNYDNSIKFDYTNATYISGCTAVTSGEGENIVTTYTLSTYEDIVPRFHVESSGGTSSGDIANNSVTTQKIADGAVTENKLSSDLKEKITNSSVIVDGSITYDKLSDDVKDRLTPNVTDGSITESKLSQDVQNKLNNNITLSYTQLSTLSVIGYDRTGSEFNNDGSSKYTYTTPADGYIMVSADGVFIYDSSMNIDITYSIFWPPWHGIRPPSNNPNNFPIHACSDDRINRYKQQYNIDITKMYYVGSNVTNVVIPFLFKKGMSLSIQVTNGIVGFIKA